MADDLPPPLTPHDCDLRGMTFMPVDLVRLFDSDLYALSTGDEFKAAFTLWGKSFLQVPAGSLPDDQRILAHLSGAGPAWPALREVALRGWVKCADGRLYHPVVAEKANEAWAYRVRQRERSTKANAVRWGSPPASPKVSPRGSPNDPKVQGQVQGQLRVEVPSSGSKEPSEGSSPAKPKDQTRKLKKPPPEIPEDTLYALAAVWNSLTADVLPSVRDLSPARMTALRARIKDHWARDPAEGFRTFVQRIMRSDFLKGENERGWRADFDFVLRPDKAQKILEGGYGIDRPEAA